MIKTHFRNCNLCEAMCGIRIETEDNTVLSIKGDTEDPFSKGFICPKAVALQDIQNDPDRLRQPLRRTDDGWQEISWQEALDFTAQRLTDIKNRFGRHSTGIYLGNPNVHNHGNMLHIRSLLKALGSRKRFSATSLDQLPHMLANLQMFGHQNLFPVVDIDNTDLFICIGANPVASNGSLMTAAGIEKRLKNIRARDGQVIVIDPRKTETSRVADEHLFIRPGTDVLLLLAMLYTVFEEQLTDSGHLGEILKGVETVRHHCHDYSPETVAEATGIPAQRIRLLSRQLAGTRRAALYGRMGVSTQAYGALCSWLIYCLNTLTGHLDSRGGLMFTLPAIDMISMGGRGSFGRYHSSVRQLPEFGGELPSAVLAEEMLTDSKEKIRAMVVVAGNPVLSAPNGSQLDQALEQLDFMVSIDSYITETSRHADIILPPTGPLERSHMDIIFPILAVRNTVKYSPPVFMPESGSLHDWEIFLQLAARLNNTGISARLRHRFDQRLGADGLAGLLLQLGPYGRTLPGSRIWGSWLEPLLNRLSSRNPLRRLWLNGAMNTQYRDLPKGLSLKYLQQHPHGVDLGPLQPILRQRLRTRDGQIQLAPQLYLDDLARVKTLLHPEPESGLKLIGRRHIRSNNSWLHNSHRLIKGKPRCTLMIHPQDARDHYIENDTLVDVVSTAGTVRIAAEITENIMPGVVSIPHGWGHHRSGVGWQTASANAGVSLNDLTDSQQVDLLSGNAVLNGVTVQIRPVSASTLKRSEPADTTYLD
ncbi:molybdopterin oxidoreductase family protein [Gynuella sunshinyii]|uniref:Anaerobic dehydrogenase, typically selenocysteine-containing n=1 Tax=Gynuella sunshinyii YC6258 TaxID=1445510 RepID=A0A0C5VC91_9GAMM|nr:molybdopterin oxidoreductase family protein [Gynuella sunshinyii]AJQ92122.1 anaerobic dehydrogenase, typically selenocysteine-containing [Gynuella sunshinyii YC6258]